MNKLEAEASWEGYRTDPQFIEKYGSEGLPVELVGSTPTPDNSHSGEA
jgi:hypothetical protein